MFFNLKTDSVNKFATNNGSKPLVIGAPRTGFSLLINVIVRLLPLTDNKVSRQDHIIRTFVELAGNHVSDAIVRETEKLGLDKYLVFNPNFRYLTGGPRWVPPEEPEVACFRKYVGIRGHGDFTLITKHSRELFESAEILHTHSNPAFWVTNPGGDGLAAYASQRNPVGTLYSSCFSLNALASEYLQHFVPPAQDNDELREQLALYKLTDLKFFAGLISPLKKYLEEFVEVRDRYRYVMGWENLLTHPARTIIEIGAAMGVAVDEDLAVDIWKEISWRNLTGWHKHNYRRGHGTVGGWKRYLTNHHLALMRDMGLEQLSLKMGYGLIPDLDPSDYTPYQQRVAAMLGRGEIYRDYPDRWMFEFAFNKSNLDSSAYSFKRYDWRENTQVERSSMDQENIVMPIWDAAEAATGAFNQALSELLVLPFDMEVPPKEALRSFITSHAGLYDRTEDAALAMLESAWEGKRAEPRLLRTIRGCNIVQFGSIFYGLPQSLGPIDLLRTDPSNMTGVVKADNYALLIRTLDLREAGR